MEKMERQLRGLVWTEISGAEPQALLNACLAEELPLIEPYAPDAFTLRLGIYERDLPRLRELAAACYCELQVLSRSGGSRNRLLLRRRLGLLLLAVLLLGGVLLSSLFVWEIRLVGAEGVSRGKIVRALEECGVESGSFWPALDADAVRDRMLLSVPELAWMTVNVRGSVAEVRLLRRVEKPEIYRESDAANLTAGHAGIVRRVSALSGKPLVQPGQAVTAGEILIAAEVDSLTAAPRTVRAQGEVWADTWYELTAVCPASEAKTPVRAGPRGRLALKIGEKRINFYQNGGKAIDGCDKIVHEYQMGISGLFRLPLSLIHEELRPYRAGTETRDMTEQLEQNLLAALSERVEGEIVSASFSSTENDGVLIVTLRARCWENIAQLVDIIP